VSDKAAEQITNIVTRMGELAASAAQGTLDSTNRSYYSDEFDTLINEIDRIANTTEFGGYKLINGNETSISMYIGFKTSADDRICMFPNCTHILSIYNHASYCHIHRSQMPQEQKSKILNHREIQKVIHHIA